MITLYTFGPHFGLPDPSPFVTKAELLLKLSGLPFCTQTGNLRRAPKGKLPYLDDDGAQVADSTFIRLHLERKHGVDFDKHLSSAEKGAAWAVEKMLEDNFYWAGIVHPRWMNDVNFDKGPRRFFDPIPAPLRPLIIRAVRSGLRKAMHGHGIGRHGEEQIVELANRSIDALAGILGNKPYLMGAHACGADATAFAFASGVLCGHFDTPQRTHAMRHSNLVAYRDRLMAEFYPSTYAST
jgi:glutathione S-transferase